MADKFVQGNWLLPNNVNASKQSNYSLDFATSASRGIYCGPVPTMFIGDSSVSVWFNSEVNNTQNVIFNRHTAGTGNFNDTYVLRNEASGSGVKIKLELGNPLKSFYSQNVYSKSVWHHLAVTLSYSSGQYTVKFYIDGVEDSPTNSPMTMPTMSSNSTLPLTIGAQRSGSNFVQGFKGDIDEISIFTKALSSGEVNSLYNSSTPGNPFDLSGDPIAYYKLGETAIGQAPGGTWDWQVPNHAQSQFAMQATQLSGAYSQIVTRYFDVGNTHTFSTWIKGTSNVGRFFLEGTPELNNNSTVLGDNIGILISNSTTINYRINGNNLTGTISPINDDEWHNIILVRTPTAAKVYIDGGSAINLTGTVASSENFNFKALTASYGSIGVGAWSGLVSNMAVWTSDRSSEVANIYNSGEPQFAYTTQPQYWYKLDNSTTFDPDFNTIRSVNSGSLSSDSYNVRSIMSLGSGPTGGLTLTFSTGNINLGTQNSISWWWSMPELYQYYNPTNFFAGNNGSDVIQWTRNTSSNYIRFTIKTGSSSSSVITFYRTDNTSLYDSMTDNNFHNYLLTRDGTNVSLYIDNNLIGTGSGTDANNNTLIEKIGGAYGGNSCCFKIAGGYYLDNFSFYNKVLSTSERATLYNSGNQSDISSLSPVYWFNADNIDTTNNNFIDLTGGSNLLPSPSLVLSYVLNNGASIGGHNPLGTLSLQSTDLGLHNPLYSQFSTLFNSNHFIIPDSPTTAVNNNSSISFWVKTNTTGNRHGMLNKRDGGGQVYYVYVNTDNTIAIDGGGAHQFSTGTITQGEWAHVALTISSGSVIFYINGSSAGTGTVNLTTNDAPTYLGSKTGGADPSNAYLSNVALFIDKTLSASEVISIYNNGKPSDISSLSPTVWWKLGDAMYTNSSNKYLLIDSINGNNSTSVNNYAPSISADAPKVVAPGSSSGLVELDKKGDSPNSTSNSISYNILKTDQSIYTPKYVSQYTVDNNYSMAFDGVDDYFNIGSSVDFAGKNFTISGWYKITKSSGASSMFSMGANKNIGIWHDGNNVVFNNKTDTSSWGGIQAGMAKNTWKHVAVTYDGSYQTIYIDGAQAVQGAKTGSQQDDGTAQWIGYLAGVSSYACEGEIDEVAIFDKALTADQIKFDIYGASTTANKSADFINNPNLPTPVVWYRMGD